MMYEINREAFNAVIACSAVDDVRYYLNSFFVDTTNSVLVATNGHVLAKVPLGRVDADETGNPQTHGLLQGFLFKRLQKPLAKKHGDLVVIDGENSKLHFPRGNKRSDREMQLEPLDGKFPDYTRIIAKPDGPEAKVSSLGLNPEYLAKPARWAGYDYAKTYIEFRGAQVSDSMFVTYGEAGLQKVEITLMGIRH